MSLQPVMYGIHILEDSDVGYYELITNTQSNYKYFSIDNLYTRSKFQSAFALYWLCIYKQYIMWENNRNLILKIVQTYTLYMFGPRECHR